MPAAAVLPFVTLAGYLDLRFGRIPNRYVLVVALVSVTWHCVAGGWPALGASLAGLLLGTLILFPLFLVRALGAGDVKFFGALGAAMTHRPLLTILFYAISISAAWAVGTIFWRASIATTAARLVAWSGRLCRQGIRRDPVVSIDSPGAMLLPFTLCVCLATWSFVCLQ